MPREACGYRLKRTSRKIFCREHAESKCIGTKGPPYALTFELLEALAAVGSCKK